MTTRVQKWGNSQGLRLSKEVLADARIALGDEVVVSARDGVILIAAARRVRGRHRLEDLVAGIPADWVPEEADWGEPAGREAW